MVIQHSKVINRPPPPPFDKKEIELFSVLIMRYRPQKSATQLSITKPADVVFDFIFIRLKPLPMSSCRSPAMENAPSAASDDGARLKAEQVAHEEHERQRAEAGAMK